MSKHILLFNVLVLLFGLSLSCQTTPPKSDEPSISTLRPRELFPYGLQNHDVTLKLGKDSLSFRGVLQREPCRIVMVGLSPLSSTLFHLEEDLIQGHIKWQAFESNLRKHEDKLPELLNLLKPLLAIPVQPAVGPIPLPNCPSVPTSQSPSTNSPPPIPEIDEIEINQKGLPKRVILKSGSNQILLLIQKYDELTVPIAFNILHPQFEIEIRVESYEIRDGTFGVDP